MITYIKIVAAGLFVASLIILGWKVAGWRHDASLLEGARLELRNEQERRIAEQVKTRKADAARLAAEQALQAKTAQVNEKVRTVKQTVVRYVNEANPDCDLPEPAASQLQHLREGGTTELPPASP